jgi:hypothetical protein
MGVIYLKGRCIHSFAVTLLTAFVILCSDRSPSSADVYLQGGDTLFISGEIKPEDVAETKTLLEELSGPGAPGLTRFATTVFLDSDGGDVYAAMDIGRLIRAALGQVNVAVPAKCLSSCALIYIAGIRRFNAGTVGLHRPYLNGSPKSAAEISQTYPKLIADVRKYVAEMGITEEFSNIMLNTDPADMRVYVTDEIKAIVPDADPQFDEIETARGARKYGIDTAEYRIRDQRASAECNSGDWYDCREAIFWGTDAATYKTKKALLKGKCILSDADRRAIRSLPIAERSDAPSIIEYGNCVKAVMLGVAAKVDQPSAASDATNDDGVHSIIFGLAAAFGAGVLAAIAFRKYRKT